MKKYFKATIQILYGYHIYSLPILFFEFYYFIKYQNKCNNFKYSNSKSLSDSIPCSFFFLQKIEKFIKNKKLQIICDLGSGYGKTIHFLGNIKKYKIDGYELDKEIYQNSLSLKNKNICIYNKDILSPNILKLKYQVFIVNDPLMKISDFKKLIDNLINIFNRKKFLILINVDPKRQLYIYKNFEIIDSLTISSKRNIFFCKIKTRS
jgi:hypothetical protein